MKIKIVDEKFIRIEPRYIVKKSSSGIISDPTKGITSTVITYKVLDENKHTKFKNKIVGVHRANVMPFDTMFGKNYFVDINYIVFIAELDDDEEGKSKEDIDRDKQIAPLDLELPQGSNLILT